MRAKFKRWFDKQDQKLWGFEYPIYTTYAERGRSPGYKLSDYWWPQTYAAYEGFKAGQQ